MQSSVLDKDRHARLIADMTHVCETANVPQSFVHRSMKGVASSAEIDWVRQFHAHRAAGIAGLAMIGVDNPDTRQMAICGALLRNFIDARIISMNTLLAQAETDAVPSPTVLLIPNVFTKSQGKNLPDWKVQILYDLLLRRFTQNKPTVLYVESLDGLKHSYGEVFASHIRQHYLLIED